MRDMIELLTPTFALSPRDCGAFATMKVKGMNFCIRCFDAAGLGHVSAMSAVGFAGLMRMETVIVNPLARNMPLLSYDRIHAMGKDALYLELYDTLVQPADLSPLDAVVEAARALPDFDPGAHWYDDIKLPQSLFKKGRVRRDRAAFDRAAEQFIACYAQLCAGAPACDLAAKTARAAAYSQGLLEHGGPAVNVFLEKFGKETTSALLRDVLFGA